MIEITPWHWAGFILFVLFCIAVDMGAFHRRARAVTFPEAFLWSGIWFALAMLFAGLLIFLRGREESAEFVAGYLIELSLDVPEAARAAAAVVAGQLLGFYTGMRKGFDPDQPRNLSRVVMLDGRDGGSNRATT